MKNILYNNKQIIIGQNSKENWNILDEYSSNAYWFHLKSFSSCFVIVNSEDIDNDIIKYAADLCKQNTKYKNVPNIKVSYTNTSNIKKADVEGSVYFKSNKKVKEITI